MRQYKTEFRIMQFQKRFNCCKFSFAIYILVWIRLWLLCQRNTQLQYMNIMCTSRVRPQFVQLDVLRHSWRRLYISHGRNTITARWGCVRLSKTRRCRDTIIQYFLITKIHRNYSFKLIYSHTKLQFICILTSLLLWFS